MANQPRTFDLSRTEIAELHRALADEGVVLPLALGGADERWWADCDLASLAENRLGERVDPRTLDDARREDWRARATVDRCTAPSARLHDACFWLLDDGERAGTVALATSLFGSALVRLSSLYVFPSHRGRGVGFRALQRLFTECARYGLGLRLETSWTWQKPVRFYLRAGLWLHFWKHDLAFRWRPDTPPPILDAGADRASVSVDFEGQRVELARAELRDGALVLPAMTIAEPRLEELFWEADSTLSLWIALNGWPLQRSTEASEHARYADAGPPEALARRIELWEAWDRMHGWRVDAPRIPGLEYRSWDTLRTRATQAGGSCARGA